jgi:hypothetical protein
MHASTYVCVYMYVYTYICMYANYVCKYACVDWLDKALLFLNTWANCQTCCTQYMPQTHAMSSAAGESWRFSVWQRPHTCLRSECPNRLWGPLSRVPEVKQSEREADITSNSVEIKNERSYTGTAPHTYMRCRGRVVHLERHGNGSGRLYNSRNTTKTVFDGLQVKPYVNTQVAVTWRETVHRCHQQHIGKISVLLGMLFLGDRTM